MYIFEVKESIFSGFVKISLSVLIEMAVLCQIKVRVRILLPTPIYLYFFLFFKCWITDRLKVHFENLSIQLLSVWLW